MDFDFLPNLPKSDLDDRRYQDLVEECILRIPRYCPEWTNHNAADPGITLIEMFAWLTDQMLLRFNQVPRRNYVAFLELLGIRLLPPTPARTDVTFYLSRAQSSQALIPAIPKGTEVATERTDTQDAIIFSTDRTLPIGVPRIRHFLTADTKEEQPRVLRDRFANTWNQDDNTGHWSGRSQFVFQERPQPGNCFYVGLDPNETLHGNVIILFIEGEPAGSTGIDPNRPPRYWEAWNGQVWRPILWEENHDETQGFSFNAAGLQDHALLRQAKVMLHLPLTFPATYFSNYHACWIRCVYQPSENTTITAASEQPQNQATTLTSRPEYHYSRAPKFTALSVEAVGGTVPASQCERIEHELLGDSSGKPGQTFQLQSGSILDCDPETEHILVEVPGKPLEIWQEVKDFADSTPSDRHYTLDAVSGEIQFGPLIKEASKLSSEARLRRRVQFDGEQPQDQELAMLNQLERQYGRVPPRGALIRMSAYRTGGGQQGNIKKDMVRIVKSALPYVNHIRNYKAAHDGADAESLEEAVVRVPQWLRTRNRAVTPEDFANLAQASQNVARAYCQGQANANGSVEILLVPHVPMVATTRQQGTAPDDLRLTDSLKKEVLDYLKPRRLLGVAVTLQEPNYISVAVQVDVEVTPQYNNQKAKQEIKQHLERRLYQFLNPVIGGEANNGWPFGIPVYESDIVSLMQKTPGVRNLGRVQLFTLQRNGSGWNRVTARTGVIHPGELGLLCSWQKDGDRTGHVVTVL